MLSENNRCVFFTRIQWGKTLTPCTLIFIDTDPGSVTFTLPRCPGHLKRHAASAGSSFGRFDEKWCCSGCAMSILNISIQFSRAGRATRIRCIFGCRPGAGVTLMWLIKVFGLTPWMVPNAWPEHLIQKYAATVFKFNKSSDTSLCAFTIKVVKRVFDDKAVGIGIKISWKRQPICIYLFIIIIIIFFKMSKQFLVSRIYYVN